jgi:hypothetical protein
MRLAEQAAVLGDGPEGAEGQPVVTTY